MQRYPLKYRLNTYQEGNFYQLVPVARRQVAPGERVSKLVLDTRFTSSVYEKANLTPMLVQSWAFYVPYRLVWDQWVDFIAMDDTVTAPPQTTVPFPALFEPGTSAKPVLARRAYKLIYNQYFGDENFVSSGGWFANVNDDTQAILGRLLIWDQYRSHLRGGAYTQQTYVAAVSGANATIQLDDLQRAIRTNNARRRQKLSGDKYVDTMRLMGVELDWRIQMAPEFLGSSQQVVFGTSQQSANSVDLVARVTMWEGQHQLVVKRPLAFAEHGIILVLTGFRPLVSVSGAGSIDSGMLTLDQYFRPDTAGGPTSIPTSPALAAERNSLYLRGRNVQGTNAMGFTFNDPSSTNDLYPDPAGFPTAPTSGPNAWVSVNDFSVSGLTPVPALKA